MAEYGEGPAVAREREVSEDVLEAESTVEAPCSVALACDFRRRQQHTSFGPTCEQAACHRGSEAVPLCARRDMKLGELEVVRQNGVDVVLASAGSAKAVAHLLVPPLVPCTVVPVRDRDEGRLRCREYCADATPSRTKNVLGPHRGTVVLRALWVSHCLDVDRQRLGEASSDFLGGQVDHVRGRFRIGGDCSQPFLDYLSVCTAILNMSNGCSMSVIRRSPRGKRGFVGFRP